MLWGVALLLGVVVSGCATTGPRSSEHRAVEHRSSAHRASGAESHENRPLRPLIFVPGILGSKLAHAVSGESAWGGGLDVFFPRDRGYELVLPIPSAETGLCPAPDLGCDGQPQLVPTRVVETVPLGPYRQQVYSRLVRALEQRGYQLGDLSAPEPGDTLFLFDYDYRRSNLDAIRKLRSELDQLRRSRGAEELPFDLLCQSNGGYVCRYLVRYGAEFDPMAATDSGAELEPHGPPRGLLPRRMILAGTANAGALRILRELRDGRRFVPRIGRLMSPELLFSMRPLFDDLPWPKARADADSELVSVFIDQNGEPMDVDLFDAADWAEYDLSILAESAEGKFSKTERAHAALFGTRADRLHYLGQRLAEAQRLQARLSSSADADRAYDDNLDLDLMMIQGQATASPSRAVLLRRNDGWQTVFAGDREADRLSDRVQEMLAEPGDGHASLFSQQQLAPIERKWLVGPDTVYAEGTHFSLILDPVALKAIGDFFTADFSIYCETDEAERHP